MFVLFACLCVCDLFVICLLFVLFVLYVFALCIVRVLRFVVFDLIFVAF